MKRIEHQMIDGIEHKRCCSCQEWKPLDEFHKARAQWDGRQPRCKLCTKALAPACRKYNKVWRQTLQGRYSTYKKGAERRGKTFTLTLEEFEQYWQKPCVYCGIDIDTIGLDRIDNEVGYQADNMVACCAACNKAKSTMPMMEYITMCKAVARRWSNAD